MATADELARTAAARFDFEMQFFISGKHQLVDVSSLQAGGAFDPTAAAVVSADVDPDSTEIPVDSTTGFTTGVLVVAPYATGEEYELVAYGSLDADSFNELTRGQFTTLDSGYHGAGAAVSEWVDVTSRVTRCDLSAEDRDGIVTWSAALQGIGYNSRLLDNDNSLLAMWRFRPYNSDFDEWSPWVVAFIGYLSEATDTDDYKALLSWRATVQGISQYLESSDCPAHNFGRNDLATSRPVQVSSALADPYLERTSGEFIGTPSLDGENLVDGDLGTLWISNVPPDTTPEAFEVPAAPQSAFSINEVYLQSPLGLPDIQWIEIAYKCRDPQDGSLSYYNLVASCSHWKWVTGSDGMQYRVPDNHFIDLTHGDMPSLDQDGGFALIVSNRARFEARWGIQGAAVVDWRDRMVGTFTINPLADFLGWHFYGDSRSRESVVWFGAIGPNDYTHDTENNPGSGWTGATVAVPGRGHSLRRSPCNRKTDPDAAANFIADEDVPTPGERITGEPEWLSIDLGDMGITLSAALLVGVTAEAAVSATLGLTASGEVKIDDEIIGYTTRDDTNDKLLVLTRALYGTTEAEHPISSVVQQYEGGIAYTAPLISSVLWRRRPVLSGTQYVVPKRFDVYISTFASPIMPDDEAWGDDAEDYWTRIAGVANWQGVEWQTTFDALRARHVLILVLDMSDGGRVKLNEVHVYAATFEGESSGGSGQIDGAKSGYIIKYLLCEGFGLPEAAFTMTDDGGQFDTLDTTKSRYMDVLRDLLHRTGCMLIFGFDETVEHRNSPYFPIHGAPEVETTWTRSNARTVELTRPYRHNVSQVVLKTRNPMTDSRFEVRYPPTALPLGSEFSMEDLIVGSLTDALLLVEQKFRQLNGPLSAVVVPVGPGEWIRPGQRHLVTWDMDEEGTYLSGRNFVVQAVSWSMDFGVMSSAEQRAKRWDCTVRLQELTF